MPRLSMCVCAWCVFTLPMIIMTTTHDNNFNEHNNLESPSVPQSRLSTRSSTRRWRWRTEGGNYNICVSVGRRNCRNVTSWYNTYNPIDSASNRQLFTEEKSKVKQLGVSQDKIWEEKYYQWIGSGWKSIIECVLIEFNVLNGVD